MDEQQVVPDAPRYKLPDSLCNGPNNSVKPGHRNSGDGAIRPAFFKTMSSEVYTNALLVRQKFGALLSNGIVLDGSGVNVGVLDTGVDTNHVGILNGQRKNEVFVNAVDFTGSRFGVLDVQGHGTHVSGIIRTSTQNIGMAPRCTLIPVKVLGDDGSGSIEGIARGIRHAVSCGAQVINMSLGGDGDIEPILRDAIDSAIASGVVVCVAAGNSGPYPETIGNPGCHKPCITVGAVDFANAVTEFSSRGSAIDICTYGKDILSTLPNSRMGSLSGTSMATPLITGVVAVAIQFIVSKVSAAEKALGVSKTRNTGRISEKVALVAANAGFLTPHAFFEGLLRLTASDIGKPGFDTDSGCGVFNFDAFMTSVNAQVESYISKISATQPSKPAPPTTQPPIVPPPQRRPPLAPAPAKPPSRRIPVPIRRFVGRLPPSPWFGGQAASAHHRLPLTVNCEYGGDGENSCGSETVVNHHDFVEDVDDVIPPPPEEQEGEENVVAPEPTDLVSDNVASITIIYKDGSFVTYH